MTGVASAPRAVVADDSHFMRSVISDILDDGGIEVVASARNGQEALGAVCEHDPDVVTMDVEMPEMNGIEATERIMAEHPTPILMLSAHTGEGADVTFEALEKGAVDFFCKPGGEVSMEMSRLNDQLVEVVTSVAAVDPTDGGNLSTAAAAGNGTVGATPAAKPDTTYAEDATVVIGSSTGGPTVVESVLSNLPTEAGLKVLVVQHMPDGFTGRFAQRLDSRSHYSVREAGTTDRIEAGEAVIAAGDHHLNVTDHRRGTISVERLDSEPVNSVKPAVDVTMKSAAAVVEGPLVGVILTGMGTDGVDGVRAIKQARGYTIAQDEATSVVFGMPKRAIETGCIDGVAPVDDIPAAILEPLEEGDH